MGKKKILVVGQTPPPIGGQAMMIQYMLSANYERIELFYVKMRFSREFSERGKVSIYKVLHLLNIVFNIWKCRFLNHTKILYYPLSSAPKVALLRDVIILGMTRFLFKKIIFHFHAAGVSEELPKYNSRIIKTLCYNILKKPDIAITSSVYNPKDGEYLNARTIRVVPLGIPDENMDRCRTAYNYNKGLRILFVGLMNSTKGEGYLLDAIYKLKEQGIIVKLLLAGRFETQIYKNRFFDKVEKFGLSSYVEYLGVVSGPLKKKMFLNSDILCFPSFFNSESFGMVLLEAMMYQMPVIASRWRGIQSVVEEDKNGFLVDIKNSDDIALRIAQFHKDRILLKQMSEESRKIYESKYKIDRYIKQIEKVFLEI